MDRFNIDLHSVTKVTCTNSNQHVLGREAVHASRAFTTMTVFIDVENGPGLRLSLYSDNHEVLADLSDALSRLAEKQEAA